MRRPGSPPEPYPQGFGLGGTTLINGSLASPDPELFAVTHLLPLEKAERLGMLGSDADPSEGNTAGGGVAAAGFKGAEADQRRSKDTAAQPAASPQSST